MAIKYEISSENIFADLGIKNPEEALAKSELAIQIQQAIRKKKLTQKKAAELLGIDQPKISALLSGKLGGFSLERLIRFLNALGADVTINVTKKLHMRKKGTLNINSEPLIAAHIHSK